MGTYLEKNCLQRNHEDVGSPSKVETISLLQVVLIFPVAIQGHLPSYTLRDFYKKIIIVIFI
jgi:hypothetical protein